MSRHRPSPGRWLLLVVLMVLVGGCTPPFLPAPLSPETTATAPAPPVVGGVITIGVDDNIRGFNPYVLSQYSPVGDAIAALVLPSVFAPGATGPNDQPTALVDDVAVTETDPFTVTYSLNRSAAWSDGTPIAAEDFSYLWTQMTTNQGLVNPGGYELIRSVDSLNAGKTVVVVFNTPFADWRTLFSPLLPARTLKDEPGGFGSALQTGIPVTGGRYRMEAYQQSIGQISLVRNDKYWVAETTANQVVFRSGAPADLVESMRRGDVQALYFQPTAAELDALRSLSTVRLTAVPLPVSVELTFNHAAGRTAAELVIRQAVAAGLGTADIRLATAVGEPSGALAPVSQLILPADPAATGTSPPAGLTDNPAQVATILGPAGFTRDGLYFRRGGVLTLTLGYLLGDVRQRTVARLMQRQLGAVGIQINLVAQTDADFFTQLTANSPPDLRLVTAPRGPSRGATAVTALGCDTAFNPAVATSSSSTTVATAPTSPTSVDPVECPESTSTALARLLVGSAPIGELDQLLWNRLTVVPLAEPVAVLALGPALDAVSVPADAGALLWGGPLHTLPEWPPPG